jgi:hypothetical protein
MGRQRPYARLSGPLLPSERTLCDRALAAIRVVLDAEAFATVWAAGRAMTLEQAIGYALEEPASSTG